MSHHFVSIISAIIVPSFCFVACSSANIQKEQSQLPPIILTSPAPIVNISPPPMSINSSLEKQEICPYEMKHISGFFCTEVIQKCIRYLDPPESKFARCAEFAPSICTGKKVAMDFCIETEEHHPQDSVIVSHNVSWNEATEECKKEGKYLCGENQWTFACEGNEIFPHTTGYIRPSDKCNFDKTHLIGDKGEFRDQGLPITENKECVSPFGVHNMNGNYDEFVRLEHPYYPPKETPQMSGLKGGWWGGMRDRCRPITKGHGELFKEVQTSFRCCSEKK